MIPARRGDEADERNGDGRRQNQNDWRQKDFQSVGTFCVHRLPGRKNWPWFTDTIPLASQEQQLNDTSTYTRRFTYNTAGFLQKLSDSFQENSHSGGGYIQPAFGSTSRITFKTQWTADRCRQSHGGDIMTQLEKKWTEITGLI